MADRTILAADLLIIPLTPSIYDFRGFENFLQRYEQVKGLKEAGNGSVRAFILMNRVVVNTKISKDIEDAVKEYEVEVLKSKLANRVAYIDTATEGIGVTEYKDAKAKKEMESLTKEILGIIE